MLKMSNIVVLLFCVLAESYVESAPSVRFSFGTVEGLDLLSQGSGRPVSAYYGIPYAQPPTGDGRFRAPQPYRGRGAGIVISSQSFRESCMQPVTDFGPYNGVSEDCLHLNVFTPGTTSSSPRQVLVWIHGGGYVVGDAVAYLPTALVADHDVIVVTVHYRLGYFGFLPAGWQFGAGGDSNNGLRDQLMALKWVQDNIASFGGSPNDVTIFGESAGSGSAALLAISPLSRGLFTRVVLMSGTPFSPWAMQNQDRAERALRDVGGRLGCLSVQHALPGGLTIYHEALLDCLRRAPAMNLTVGSPPSVDIRENQWAAPYVDGDVIPGPPEVLMQDVAYLRSNGVLDRSYMVGSTNLEGYSAQGKNIFTDTDMGENGWQTFVEICAKYSFPMTTNAQVKDLIDFVYSYPRESPNTPPFSGFQNLWTDAVFTLATSEYVNYLAAASPTTDIFHYVFDHYPDLKNTSQKAKGTPHATDLMFLFDEMPQSFYFFAGLDIDLSAPDSRAVTDVYRGTIAEFAKTGNPSRSRSGGLPTVWPRYDLTDRKYMALSPRPQSGNRAFSQRMSLWQDFLPKVATNLFTGERRGW